MGDVNWEEVKKAKDSLGEHIDKINEIYEVKKHFLDCCKSKEEAFKEGINACLQYHMNTIKNK